MYWADEVAQKLKERKLPLEWVDDMKTPSGRIHIGSLRGVVVHDLACKALVDRAVPTKYTYLFENSDPMDDLPSYLPREKFEKYLGLPLFKVPSPEPGYKNYAEYFALEFKRVFNAIGCNPEIIWTADLYTSGRMNGGIKLCLDNADVIRKIYEELYKKSIAPDWYPFQVYCEQCSKVVTTRVTHWDGEEVTYTCKIDAVNWTKGCGYEGKVSPFSTEKRMNGKLPWKVEWPIKWKVVGVTVEGAGKDHMSAGGSHDLASMICERVLHYTVPYPIASE
jgi:lysyl-tRNA synthetase, class I